LKNKIIYKYKTYICNLIYRVFQFKWASRITLKEMIFKENDPDKSYCTQRGTSNGDLEIVLNDLPPRLFEGQSIFFDGMT